MGAILAHGSIEARRERLCDASGMPKLIPPVVAAGTLANVPQPHVPIDGELELRPLRLGDAPSVVTAFSTADIQHYHFRRFDIDEAQLWIFDRIQRWTAETTATWAVAECDGGDMLGSVAITMSLEDGYGAVSYWVLPAGRGRRIATRACVAATRWAHDVGIHRVQLEHSTANEPSRGVAQRAGFVPEGIRRGANLHDDGWHDMVLHSHLSTDGWPEPSAP
jgi:ribosomal-protein-alanine N-acetyltransferase